MLCFVVPRWKKSLIALLLVMVLCPATIVFGSGFALFTQGASALGQGNAVIAHTSDASAVFYNPALINTLPGTQVMVGTVLMTPSRSYTSSLNGITTEADNKLFFPSTLYITHAVTDNLSAGLGVFSPFGLGTKWGDSWEGRYISTNSELQTFNINPVVSYKVFPILTLAAGVDLILLDATLEKKRSLAAAGLPDAGQKFKGDGNGVGYNVGVLLDLPEGFSFGASYRSEVKVKVEGDATFTVPAGSPPSVVALLQNSRGSADLTLPQQVLAGIAYKGFAPLTLEAGVRWEGWSSFDQLKIDLANGRSDVTPRNWKDVFSYNVGARYQVNPAVALLAGYLHGDSPVPDSTFDPTIPDSVTDVYSLGTELSYRKFKFALSYAYQVLHDRAKVNSLGAPAGAANGIYGSDIHMVGLSAGYAF
ncbi:MAG: transporter [Geobacter sp.]|nr:MAG: transporter [Geobacter sp.]